METIFIAMPAFDDSELVPTILDAFAKAKNPERIHFGVSIMWSRKSYLREFKRATSDWSAQIKFVDVKVNTKNIWNTFGVGRGRKLASGLYSQEDYVLQCDSHTFFAENWDETLIDLHKEATETLGLPKVLITGYAGHYAYDESGKRVPTTDGGRPRFPFMVNSSRFSDLIPNWLDFPLPDDTKKKFHPAIKFNANFSFGDAEFGKYNGLFEEAVFFEEELMQTINLVKAGFNFVFPHLLEPLICHLYSSHVNEKGGYRTSLKDYVPLIHVKYFDTKTASNYLQFIEDPANWQTIKRWERYSKASLRYGTLRENHMPEYYINAPDSSLKSE